MDLTRWLLGSDERGNTATVVDRRHLGGLAWTDGNDVRPLVHGATYFAELLRAVRAMRSGDLLFFTDWRGDPDELLDGPGSEVGRTLCEASRRGVVVRGLVWRSHLDKFRFSDRENKHLGEEIEAAGGVCLLDMRVRPGGSHHQKFVVLRHPGRPELDVAYVGGIDLCHGRHDDASHQGDPQSQPMAAVFGARPPWHDIQLAVRGPAVGDVEATFRERWDDPAPLSRNPARLLHDRMLGLDTTARALPPPLDDPEPCGTASVQLLRTYARRRPGYPFAPAGERSVARGVIKALGQARSMIYVEDQFLWSTSVAASFARALRDRPDLLFLAVVPMHPDQDGKWSEPPNHIGRNQALRLLRRAGGDRVAVYGIENGAGIPIYVHAKACIIDDTWASVGSDNVNRRSWTYDSELSCAVVDTDGGTGGGFARQLRLTLVAEHLGEGHGDLEEPRQAWEAFARSASELDRWHADGRRGPRPPGQLRRLQTVEHSPTMRAWATLSYRTLYDPDGRPRSERRADRW